MIYAPIVIPTINRYKHLERCINSLRSNKLSTFTELYISLDYPPSEKYMKGYLEIKKYLKKGIEGFKKVHIFYHDTNLGAYGNMKYIMFKAYEKHGCLIFTEDDNEFSKNFLSFINQNLDKYWDVKGVYAICGYSFQIEWDMRNGEGGIDNLFSAFGFAVWKHKDLEMRNKFTREILIKKIKKTSNIIKLYKYSKTNFCDSIIGALGYNPLMLDGDELAYIDSTIGIYAILENKIFIMPEVSKVRNHGFDGSGLHCIEKEENNSNQKSRFKTINDVNFSRQYLDEEIEYIMPKNTAVIPKPENRKKLNHYISISKKQLCKVLAIYILFRFTGNVDNYYRFINKIKKLLRLA